jgi:DNA-binding CsgD family transcriptional regulator
MRDLSAGHDAGELRLRVGRTLLDLLDADHFASYVWDSENSTFAERVSINMSDDNLTSYETYYRFRDPITPVLQRRRSATGVSEIMARRRFEKTEFFNDFLARDGLHYGVNYYAYAGGTNIGDLRIWRGKNKEDFSRREVEILDAIGPAFTNAMRTALAREGAERGKMDLLAALDRAADSAVLTAREKEICAAVLAGLSDQKIADKYGISFTTVRSHLKHIYEKFGISGRTQLLSKVVH